MRPAFLIAAIVALCVGGDVHAAKAVLKGPRFANPGDLVQFDASQSDALGYRWNVWPKVEGRDAPRPSMDGRSCEVPSYPGRYLVQLIVCDAEGGIDDAFATLIISGDPPSPIPTPQPPSPPAPTPPSPGPSPIPPSPPAPPAPPVPPGPAPKFPGLTGDVYTWAMAVSSSRRATEAAALADAAEKTAQDVHDAKISSPGQISKALVAANATALGGDAPAWEPFAKNLVARVEQLYGSGKLKERTDWEAMLREAAAGLRQASK
jgi:hypothetical protein